MKDFKRAIFIISVLIFSVGNLCEDGVKGSWQFAISDSQIKATALNIAVNLFQKSVGLVLLKEQ